MDAFLNGCICSIPGIYWCRCVVMLPFIIMVIGLIFRLPIAKAFKSGITITCGFVGINLLVNLLKSAVSPAAAAHGRQLWSQPRRYRCRLGRNFFGDVGVPNRCFPGFRDPRHQHFASGSQEDEYYGRRYLELPSYDDRGHPGFLCDPEYLGQ